MRREPHLVMQAPFLIGAEMLNVRKIDAADSLDEYVAREAKPSFPILGKRFGKKVPAVVKAIKALGETELSRFQTSGEISVDAGEGPVTLTREELSVEIAGKSERFGAREDRGVTVVLDLEIDEPLRLEGLAREAVNRLQNLRKKAGFDVTDRIDVRYRGGDVVGRVFAAEGALIKSETLAETLAEGPVEWEHGASFTIDDETFELWIQKAGQAGSQKC